MTVNFFVQTRLGSSRYPGKCLEPVLGDVSLLESIDRRIRRSRYHTDSSILYLTSTSAGDDRLAGYLGERGWPCLRGSEDDVFSRFRAACERNRPDFFVRICGDNPLLDPGLLDRAIDRAIERNTAYTSFADPDGTPVILTHYGFFAEVVSASAFLALDIDAIGAGAREHVTPPFYATGASPPPELLPVPEDLADPGIRLTVDTPADMEVVRYVFAQGGLDVTMAQAYRILRGAPEIMAQMKAAIGLNQKN